MKSPVLLIVPLLALAACSPGVTWVMLDRIAVVRPASPRGAGSDPFDSARAAGARLIDHTVYPLRCCFPDDVRDTQLIVVQPEVTTVIPGFVPHEFYAPGEPIAHAFYLGVGGRTERSGAMARWFGLDDHGRVTVQLPKEMEGAVIAVRGWDGTMSDEGRNYAPIRLLACGKVGLAHYYLFRERYADHRRRALQPLPDLGGEERLITDLTVDPVAIFARDLDSDGRFELIVFAFVSYLDGDGEEIVSGDEIGIISLDRHEPPATRILGPAGNGFPRLEILSR